jgi:DNA invertase Pin-like site-specific DNA recombinase
MIYGYARVSTEEQNLNLQTDALKSAGCEKIFKEKISAAKERPELEKLIKALQPGDTLYVWKLDRLGRSLWHLIDLIKNFEEKGIKFNSLQDHINTATHKAG